MENVTVYVATPGLILNIDNENAFCFLPWCRVTSYDFFNIYIMTITVF